MARYTYIDTHPRLLAVDLSRARGLRRVNTVRGTCARAQKLPLRTQREHKIRVFSHTDRFACINLVRKRLILQPQRQLLLLAAHNKVQRLSVARSSCILLAAFSSNARLPDVLGRISSKQIAKECYEILDVARRPICKLLSKEYTVPNLIVSDPMFRYFTE